MRKAKRLSSLKLEKFIFYDVVAVTCDGSGGDAYCCGNLFAEFSGGQQLHDFEFARGERTAGEGMIGAGFACWT